MFPRLGRIRPPDAASTFQLVTGEMPGRHRPFCPPGGSNPDSESAFVHGPPPPCVSIPSRAVDQTVGSSDEATTAHCCRVGPFASAMPCRCRHRARQPARTPQRGDVDSCTRRAWPRPNNPTIPRRPEGDESVERTSRYGGPIPLTTSSGEDFGFLRPELGLRDHPFVPQVGQLGQLVRGSSSGDPLDIGNGTADLRPSRLALDAPPSFRLEQSGTPRSR
jgi:hypothetical protein